ncbi:uncharacterized protein LOC62_01G000669 [Vanrija pseudolonga]|uniref:Uncharacterized protein n=1 Tax=Vanrija pseudolonga TaxID=143232 RepID=A0AAF0XZK9_9TREE|nr:hypothetical protein LOC62_01G000669 [Vanrija pseudolonga]
MARPAIAIDIDKTVVEECRTVRLNWTGWDKFEVQVLDAHKKYLESTCEPTEDPYVTGSYDEFCERGFSDVWKASVRAPATVYFRVKDGLKQQADSVALSIIKGTGDTSCVKAGEKRRHYKKYNWAIGLGIALGIIALVGVWMCIKERRKRSHPGGTGGRQWWRVRGVSKAKSRTLPGNDFLALEERALNEPRAPAASARDVRRSRDDAWNAESDSDDEDTDQPQLHPEEVDPVPPYSPGERKDKFKEHGYL